MKFSPQKGILFGVIVNLLIIVSLVWVSYRRVQNDKAIRNLEEQRDKVSINLEKQLSNLTRMQNSAKGYAISGIKKSAAGIEKYSLSFKRDVFEAEKNLIEIENLFRDNPSQQNNLKELMEYTSKKTQYFNQLIEYAKYKEFEEVKNFFFSENLDVINKIDKIISLINSKEEELFIQEKSKMEDLEKSLKIAFYILIVFSLVLPVIGYLITRYYLKERIEAAALLEGNKQLLQSIIDNTTNPVFIKEINGQYLLVNKQFQSMFGTKDGNITGKTDYDIFSKELADKMRANDLEVIKAGKELKFEEVYPQNNDPHTYIMVRFPISNNAGTVYALGGIATDISEQKKTQFQLIENEELIKTIFDAAPEAVIMMDEDSKIVKWNHKAEELFKWTSAEAIGKPIYDIIMPQAFKEAHQKGMKEFLKTGDGPVMNKSLEVFAIKKNNVVFEVEIIISSILIKGKYVFIAFLRDITQKKQLEQESQRTRNFLSLVIENIPDTIIVKDAREFRFVSINKAAEKLLGYSRNEMIGKTDSDFFPKDQVEAFTEKDKSVIEKKQLIDIPEEEIETKNGKRWLKTKKLPILDEKEKPLYVLAISDDITEDKRLEDEKSEASKKLHENEQRLELILENIGEGVFVADAHQNTLLFNRMAEEILELKGGSFSSDWSNQYNIYFPDGKTVFPAQDLPTEKALKGYSTNETEIILENPDTKKRKLVKVSGHPMRDDNNDIIAAVTTIKDITKMKEMERALEESESNYRKLIGFRR